MRTFTIERHTTMPRWARALRHLKSFNPSDHEYIAKHEMTQDGIAEALGVTRPHASLILKHLTENNFAMAQLSYIDGAKRRRLAYFITPKGFEMIRQLGEKEVPCEACNGNGYIDEMHPELADDPTPQCNVCKGTGVVLKND